MTTGDKVLYVMTQPGRDVAVGLMRLWQAFCRAVVRGAR